MITIKEIADALNFSRLRYLFVFQVVRTIPVIAYVLRMRS